MNTKQKIEVAKFLSHIICSFRRGFGLGSRIKVRRKNILWDLDLQEGFDLCIYLTGCIEWATFLALKKTIKPGDIILDIGANLGGHLLPIADMVGEKGKVYGFEASHHAFQRQRNNVELNPYLAERIQSYHVLLMENSNAERPEKIYSSWPLNPKSDAQLHPVHLGQLHSVGQAEVFSIDEWSRLEKPKKINLLKVDVDGYEVPVLRGCTETIKKYRPILLLEFAPYIHQERGYLFKDLLKLLKDLNYSGKTLKGKSICLDEAIEAKIPPFGSLNVMLFPSS